MFTHKKTTTEPTALEEEIDRLIEQMSDIQGHTEDYTHIAANLKVLMEAKATEAAKPTLSPDTVATVAGSILGIVMILGFEHMNVITTKALGFIIKPKV